MLVTVEGTFSGGQIRLKETPAGLEGARVIVTFLLPHGGTVENLAERSVPSISGQELLESEAVGMWASREDIPDSPEFSRQLREKAQRR